MKLIIMNISDLNLTFLAVSNSMKCDFFLVFLIKRDIDSERKAFTYIQSLMNSSSDITRYQSFYCVEDVKD